MNFVVYSGNSPAKRQEVVRQSRDFWGDCRVEESDGLCISMQKRDNDLVYYCEDNVHLCLAGYVGNDLLKDPNEVYSALLSILTGDTWPLDDDWFGSFACVAVDGNKRRVVVANDAIGYYCVYYSVLGARELIAGSSQIVLNKAMRRPPDAVGLLQAISRPNFSNYGRRTLIQGLSRPLPGESIAFSGDYSRPVSRYDNSLYSDVQTPPIGAAAEQVFGLIKKHVAFLCKPGQDTYLALSGGWDSRVLLGAAAKGRLNCVTHGQESFYETHIARKCADASGGRFFSIPTEPYYFPSDDVLSEYVNKTEALYHPHWLAVLQELKPGGEFPVFMLGDMCEAIDGRAIKTYSTRRARKRSFWKSLVGMQDRFVPLDEENFASWQEAVVDETVAQQMANFPLIREGLWNGSSPEEIKSQLAEDVLLTTGRVRDNAPAFRELLDELFSWYIHARVEGSKQMLVLSSSFACINPGMSFQIIRMISKVHPSLRLRRRLMSAIARLKAFDALGRIPSSQIPYLGMRAPALLKEMMWGARSMIDQILIRRMLRTKNPNARTRVLKSFNFIPVYEDAARSGVVKEWFSGDWFDSQALVDAVEDRANLRAWPLAPFDIVGPANASKVLDSAIDRRHMTPLREPA